MSWRRLILSRTDHIGDVALALPLASALKQHNPGGHIIFAGAAYTRDLVRAWPHVDEFLDVTALLQDSARVLQLRDLHADTVVHVFPNRRFARLCVRAGIARRIGTSHRWFHWLYCNELVHMSRSRASLHETQLNFQLAATLGAPQTLSVDDLGGLARLDASTAPVPEGILRRLAQDRFRLVLHPMSLGSSREWGLARFKALIAMLGPAKFQIVVTGSAREGEAARAAGLFEAPHVVDATGQTDLGELIAVIAACDGLVAAATGPLHLAALSGRHALGLYPAHRAMHPRRWAPLGPKARSLVARDDCKARRARSRPARAEDRLRAGGHAADSSRRGGDGPQIPRAPARRVADPAGAPSRPP
ncbi:MAG: glycosyltransferase family 9 protein [Armatimonadetes bacterium]|nr:glycosyltransferase family 9 protein [Armatimonadota bacterium]